MDRKFAKTSFVILLTLCSAGLFVTGCSRDPNVRKQKYFESGKRYMAKGKYPEAAIQFSNALRIDSKYADAHYQLALCDLKLNAVQNAYTELVRTILIDPENRDAELDLGNLLLGARQIDKAEQHADHILSSDPNNVGAHILKADVEGRRHELDRAIAEMNLAVRLDPQRSGSYIKLGAFESMQTPDSEKPEGEFKKAVELDPKNVQPRLALAGYYQGKKRSAEAEQVLLECVRMAPKDSGVRTALVQHYLLDGNKSAAEAAAKDAKAALSSDPEGAQFLARYYASAGDSNAALAEYRQLAQRYSKDRDIQHRYLSVLVAQGHRDDAITQIKLILNKFPRDEAALTIQGGLLLEQGNPAQAREVLQSVVKANQQNAVAHFELGSALRALGDIGQAEAQWRDATQIQPDYLPAQKALAAVALSKGDASTLAVIGKTLIQRFPDLPDGYDIQAEADGLQNDDKSAEADLLKAISVAPKYATAYVELGRMRMAEKRYSESEPVLNKALEIDPQNGEAVRSLVQLYLIQRQPEKALKRAQEFAVKSPEKAEPHLILAELSKANGNLQVAEDEFGKAVRIDPAQSTYLSLAAVQFIRQEYPAAQATYESALQKYPAVADGYWMLGNVYQAEQKLAEAESSYRRALELQPNLAIAANNLADLMLQRGGNLDQAISFAQIARRQMPNSAAVADTLGWAYYQKGVSALALEMLKEAVKGGANNATYHYHLGMAYSRVGRRTDARLELQRAMQLENGQARKEEIRKSLSALS
jgi:tetratricopeptide (TPR) repeat protein